MPRTGKTSGAREEGTESPGFEEALKRLEAIVETMEDGELALDQLLAKYEEGTRLVKACQTRLEEAETKIKKLEASVSGDAVLTTMEVGDKEEDE